MKIACPHCSAEYNVDERRIPASGLLVKCPKCQKAFPARRGAGPGEAAVTAVPLPAPGSGPAEPPSPAAAPSPRAAPAAIPLPPPATPPRAAAPAPVAPPPVAPPATAAIPLPPPPGSASVPPPVAPAAGAGALGFGEVALDPGTAGEAPAEEVQLGGGEPAPAEEEVRPGGGEPAPAEEEVPLGDGEPALAVEEIPPGGGEPLPAVEVSLGGDDPLPAAPEALPTPAEPPRPPAREPEGARAGAPAPAGFAPLGAEESEELEMLFGDGPDGRGPRVSAPAPPLGERAGGYRVRRRSGKIFGPFEESRVAEMLGKGELLGNEDVSSDGGETWRPIAAVPAFEEAMGRAMELPGARTPGQAAVAVRLGGPEAAGKGPARGARAGRLRLGIAAAGAVLLLAGAVGVGAGLFTRHGYFFARLLRGRGRQHADAALLDRARAAVAADRYPELERAVGLATDALRLGSADAAAKGVYAQAASWLKVRGGGDGGIGRARELVREIRESDPDAPGTLEARLALALAADPADVAPAARALEPLAGRAPPDEDVLVLLGEAALRQREGRRAADWFGRAAAARPGSARAAHGQALAAEALGDVKAAAAFLEKALASDPGHLSSAVELADLAARAGDAGRAEASLRRALASAADLSPRDRARARDLLAGLLSSSADPARREEAEKAWEAAIQDAPAWLPARVDYARFLLRRGAPERAVAVLTPAEEGGARPDEEATALLVRALAASGRVLDATNRADAALQGTPGRGRLLFAKGLVSELAGKRAEAEKLYEQAEAADPASWEPHLALGRSALRSGDLRRAGEELALAAEKAPGEPDAQVGLGDLRLARQDLAGAEAAYRKALELEPREPEAHVGLARVRLARGDPAGARAELELALQSSPRLFDAQMAYGVLLRRQGDLERAEKAFREAAAIDPQAADARTQLGAVELERGNAAAAVADLSAAAGLAPASAEAEYWLGRALLASGDRAPAVDRLRRAVDLAPDEGEYRLLLGMAHERADAFAEAIEDYRGAIAKAPGRLEGYERLGLLLGQLGRCEEAVPLLQKGLQVAPRVERLRVEAGDCQERLGRHADAIRSYRAALKADPGLVGVYYKIGRSIHEAFGMRQAFPWYERAARLDKGNAMAHYYLAYGWKERGQKARAVQEFRAYLRAKPDAEDRRDVEREIEDLGG